VRVKDAVGRFGEDLAAAYLIDAGLTILDRNWRCSDGELDIVAREAGAIVFVEVKTRSTVRYGDPAEAVTPAKVARIRRLAVQWLTERRAGGSDCRGELRFDVVSVVRLAANGPDVRHLRAAF
jgi:putative endonuclease